MNEPSKKNLIKSYSYYNNFPSFNQKEIATLKSNLEENLLNKSILKRTKKSSSKKVLFNINKFKIKDLHTTNIKTTSYANDSLLKTNYSKNQKEMLGTLYRNAKNTENKNINSNNEVINHNIITTDNKTLFKNKSQENFYTLLKSKNTIANNSPESKDSHDENLIYDLNLIKELGNNNNNFDKKTLEDMQLNMESINNPLNNLNLEYNNEMDKNNENKENDMNTVSNQIYTKLSNRLPKLNSRRKKKKIPFILKSRKEQISANDIIIHYLKENEKDNSKNIPFINFKKYLEKIDYRKFNYGLNKIYGNSETFLKRVNEIKKNNIIALKKDFNIEDYQNTLLKILKKRVSQKSHQKLQKSYKLFNERNFNVLIPRGRYINLAEKLKDFLSKDIYEKMKRTDRNYLLYLEKQEEQKNKILAEDENKNNFYKKLNKTLRTVNRKLRGNKSY